MGGHVFAPLAEIVDEDVFIVDEDVFIVDEDVFIVDEHPCLTSMLGVG